MGCDCGSLPAGFPCLLPAASQEQFLRRPKARVSFYGSGHGFEFASAQREKKSHLARDTVERSGVQQHHNEYCWDGTPITALNDLGTGIYLGSQGGLYPNAAAFAPQVLTRRELPSPRAFIPWMEMAIRIPTASTP